MHPETAERVAFIRGRVADAKKELDRAKTALAQNDDKYINDRIKLADFWLGDVDILYLAMLEKERFPPRSLGEELSIIYGTDMHLNSALSKIREITDMIKTYGPNVRLVGG